MMGMRQKLYLAFSLLILDAVLVVIGLYAMHTPEGLRPTIIGLAACTGGAAAMFIALVLLMRLRRPRD